MRAAALALAAGVGCHTIAVLGKAAVMGKAAVAKAAVGMVGMAAAEAAAAAAEAVVNRHSIQVVCVLHQWKVDPQVLPDAPQLLVCAPCTRLNHVVLAFLLFLLIFLKGHMLR